MGDLTGSRRAFVGGAVVGIAAIGTLGLMRFGGGAAERNDKVAVVDGDAVREIPGFTPDAAEIAHWQGIVGTNVAVAAAGFAGMATIAAVVALPVKGTRPANVRQNPFLIYFAVDHRNAPKADGLFDIGHAIDGISRIFLSRGEDRFGKASLVALFD